MRRWSGLESNSSRDGRLAKHARPPRSRFARFQRKRLRKGHAARHAIDVSHPASLRHDVPVCPTPARRRGSTRLLFPAGTRRQRVARGRTGPDCSRPRAAAVSGWRRPRPFRPTSPRLHETSGAVTDHPPGLKARGARPRPNDRLERVVRIRSGIRADSPWEDRDVMRAGRLAYDPCRSGACACVVFWNERDVDPWRDAEPHAREGPGEILPIDVPHAVGHVSEPRGCVERQLHPAPLRRQAGGGQQQECGDSADAVARPADHPTSLTCRSDSFSCEPWVRRAPAASPLPILRAGDKSLAVFDTRTASAPAYSTARASGALT